MLSVLLAHLSDMHISSGLLSRKANHRARQAVRRISALRPRPDCTVITGDLVQCGTRDEYAAARRVLDELDEGTVHVVPGNHDDSAAMLHELSDTSYVHRAPAEPERCYYRADVPGLRLLCCDSTVPGQHHGRLGPTQLRWLDAELARGTDTPAAIALHHHPVRSGIAAMDEIMLSDAAELGTVLSRHAPVTRILTGHLHRPTSSLFGGAVVTSAPSTERQVHLDLDPQAPGAFVEEPAGILLHRLDGIDDVTHLVPLRRPGQPVDPF